MRKLNPALMESWNKGYNAGVRKQRESDIQSLFNLLQDLERIPGIGEKRDWDIREHFLRNFGIDINDAKES